MVDEHNKNNQEEEYRFPEDEYIKAHSEPSAQYSPEEELPRSSAVQAANILDKIQRFFRNRVVIVVVMVVIFVMVFRFLTSHKNHTLLTTTPHKLVTTQPQMVKTPLKTFIPNPKVEGKINALVKATQNNDSSVSNLRLELEQLQIAINHADENDRQLDHAVAVLATEINQIKKRLITQKPKKMVKKIKPIVYHVRAIIPGRAWIYGTNGHSTSIALGDSVKQYGRVLGINAQRGTVLTSSGKIIEFSSTDR